MPDPIKGLENFDPAAAGGAMDPLPASEVRRRGDRLRRRNTALVTVAAAIAVAVVVAPIAVIAGGRDSSGPPAGPSPTPTPTPAQEWVQQIPAGFDLTRNLPDSRIGEPPAQSPTGAGVTPALGFCGEPLPLGAPVDRLTVNVSGFQRASDRELLVYADAEAAAAQVAALRDDVRACPTEGSPPHTFHEARPSGFGPESRVLLRTFPDVGGEIFQVVRVGNAVLLTHTFGDYGPDILDSIPREAERVREVVADLCVFSVAGCGTPSDPDAPTEAVAIPGDFPLDLDLPDYGAAGTLEGPSATVAGVEIDVCRSEQWPPPDDADRLAVIAAGEDSSERRELLVMASADTAVAVLDGVRALVGGCPAYLPPGGGSDLVVTEHSAVTGYDSVSFSVVLDGESGGGRLYTLARVGSAILALQSGSTALDSSGGRVPEHVDLVRRIAPSLCLWTRDGCADPTSLPSPSPPSGPSDPGDIPGDFPLAAGWPDDSGVEGPQYGLRGPNRTLEPLAVEACGTTAANPPYADRLRADWTNVEDFRFRQLTTYADADAAVAAVAALVEVHRACPAERPGSDGHTPVREVRRTAVGGESWALVTYYEFGGAPAVGLRTMHVIRLGRSVLILDESTEGGAGPDREAQIQGQLDAMTAAAAEPIAALCAFTEAGC